MNLHTGTEAELTGAEQKVVLLLKDVQTETIQAIADSLGITRRTVQRALRKHGYYSSINHNSSYVALREAPSFDGQGLWRFRNVCFSKHGTLEKTVLALITESPDGMTIQQLEAAVGTKAHNMVSLLAKRAQIGRFFHKAKAVYIAADAGRGEAQRARRIPQPAAPGQDGIALPAGFEPLQVIRILVQIIISPKADAGQIAGKLRTQGAAASEAQILQVIKFYMLKKKRKTA